MVISQIFAQTTIDTLSVTIYPEFSYPGVAIEYKFDKFGSDVIEFPVSSDIDSVLYTVSGDGLEFEQILNGLNPQRAISCLGMRVSPSESSNFLKIDLCIEKSTKSLQLSQKT